MNILAELSCPSDRFPFSEVIAETGASRIEFEPFLPLNRFLLPFFRVWKQDVEVTTEAIRDSPAVESVQLLETGDETGLFWVEWIDDEVFEWLRNATSRTDVIPVRAVVDRDKWRLRVRASEDELPTFQQHCRDEGIEIELTAVTTTGDADGNDRYGLTPAQREALSLAATHGYFDRPREVTLAELADELAISRQAFAGRLRRGQRTLIRRTLQRP